MSGSYKRCIAISPPRIEPREMPLNDHLARRVSDYGNRRSLGFRFRAHRIRRFLGLIDGMQPTTEPVRILDLGGTRTYWQIVPEALLAENRLAITIVNLPGELSDREDSVFRFVSGDGCDLSSFDDNSFDVVHSNSVLEHVGDWSRMKAFAHEIRRLAPRYFVQTPNFWFPVEPHFMFPFFHWLPEPVRVRMMLLTGLGHYAQAHSVDGAVTAVQSARLVNRRMMSSLFPDAAIFTERVALLPKSLMAIRNASETSRATTRA